MATATAKKAAPAKSAAPAKAAAPKSTSVRKRTTGVATAKNPLEHLIPPKERADEYISRTIDGIQDVNLLRYAKEANKHVLFSGPTGLGKSHLVEAYCAADNMPLVVIEAKDGIDPATFFGGFVPKDMSKIDPQVVVDLVAELTAKMPKGTEPSAIMQLAVGILTSTNFEWVYSDVVKLLTTPSPTGACLFIDEVNFMRGRITATFHRILRERKFSILERNNELLHVAPGVQVVAAYNHGYESTFPLNKAFVNRFALKPEVDYDKGVESQLCYMPTLLEVADKLRGEDAGVESPVSTNMLVEFEEFAVDIGLDFAVKNFTAAFEKDERPAVAEVFALYDTKLRKDLKALEAEGA